MKQLAIAIALLFSSQIFAATLTFSDAEFQDIKKEIQETKVIFHSLYDSVKKFYPDYPTREFRIIGGEMLSWIYHIENFEKAIAQKMDYDEYKSIKRHLYFNKRINPDYLRDYMSEYSEKSEDLYKEFRQKLQHLLSLL